MQRLLAELVFLLANVWLTFALDENVLDVVFVDEGFQEFAHRFGKRHAPDHFVTEMTKHLDVMCRRRDQWNVHRLDAVMLGRARPDDHVNAGVSTRQIGNVARWPARLRSVQRTDPKGIPRCETSGGIVSGLFGPTGDTTGSGYGQSRTVNQS